MKKKLRRALRRLVRKQTPWTAAERKLKEIEPTLSKKELKEIEAYYGEKLKKEKVSPSKSKRRRPKKCRHSFPFKRDADGNYIFNKYTQEHETEPCIYCGVIWGEVRQDPPKTLTTKFMTKIDGKKVQLLRREGHWFSRSSKKADFLPLPKQLDSDEAVAKLYYDNLGRLPGQ